MIKLNDNNPTNACDTEIKDANTKRYINLCSWRKKVSRIAKIEKIKEKFLGSIPKKPINPCRKKMGPINALTQSIKLPGLPTPTEDSGYPKPNIFRINSRRIVRNSNR